MLSDRSKYSIIVALVAASMAYAYGRIDYQNPGYSTWDLHDYRAMAQAVPSLTENVRQPFVFRILGPYVAGIMPMSTDVSFLMLSVSLGLILSLLFYSYLCSSIVKPPIAALATVLFILNKYLYGFPVWNYFHVNDILSQIEIVLLMWTMISQKWVWFGIVLLLGSLTRETPLIMMPVAFVFALEMKHLGRLLSVLLIAVLPALVTAIALRILLHSDQGYNLPQAFMAYADKLLLLETWFRLLINCLIPFSLVPLIFFETSRHYFRTRKYAIVYLVLVVISTFFGYNSERLMAPVFIVFYPLLAIIIEKHIAQSRWIILTVIIAAIVSQLHHTYARFPLPRELTIGLSLLAFAIVTLSMIYYKIRMARVDTHTVSQST